MEKDLSGVRVALLSTGALFSAYKNMHSFYFTSIFSGDIFYRGRILELAPEFPANLNRAWVKDKECLTGFGHNLDNIIRLIYSYYNLII